MVLPDKSVPEGVARNRFHFLEEMGDDLYIRVINGGIGMFNTPDTSQLPARPLAISGPQAACATCVSSAVTSSSITGLVR